ncbi:hypothetical protein [Enterococcus faecium]|uniref:hypothetical protein n=1 Tax=Enterococcus TaxID=1350 RepID=UPI0019132F98|nr:hypothetical protein [Enterococcus faecium]MBK5028914.1 hypothetical protein [Enterococcus faecium]MBK5039630.1 hypothetical protein [Enterococcus faecium]MBK5044557.1 hypothetical protein [Enterococcus faecium]MBK5069485.1 hypothetical protein [Enterococcus faecium]MBK5132737.1 hypothetical protein [Enterococcus faecium]
MKLTKFSIILAIIEGIILYFVLPTNQFFLYFGIPAILIVNGVRIFEQRKKLALPNRCKASIPSKIKQAKLYKKGFIFFREEKLSGFKYLFNHFISIIDFRNYLYI